jgi:hypothetical protein
MPSVPRLPLLPDPLRRIRVPRDRSEGAAIRAGELIRTQTLPSPSDGPPLLSPSPSPPPPCGIAGCGGGAFAVEVGGGAVVVLTAGGGGGLAWAMGCGGVGWATVGIGTGVVAAGT